MTRLKGVSCIIRPIGQLDRVMVLTSLLGRVLGLMGLRLRFKFIYHIISPTKRKDKIMGLLDSSNA